MVGILFFIWSTDMQPLTRLVTHHYALFTIHKKLYLCASKKIIIMANIEFNNKTYEMDGDGFMVHPEEWNKELAAEIAKADGITEMTENHWKVVDCIRANYEEKGIAPMVRTICKTANLKLKDIYELFPLGPARGACRVAGLPKPEGCV